MARRKRISVSASAYLTAVLEYLTSKILNCFRYQLLHRLICILIHFQLDPNLVFPSNKNIIFIGIPKSKLIRSCLLKILLDLYNTREVLMQQKADKQSYLVIFWHII